MSISDNLLDIILIEDNPHDIELTIEALREHNLGNRVKVLKDGEDAIAYIFRLGRYVDSGMAEQPSLIILDVRLPKIDGLDILRRIRADERTKAIPVVMFSSSHSAEDRIKSYQLGANSYITKPIGFDDFAKIVSQIGLDWTALNQRPD